MANPNIDIVIKAHDQATATMSAVASKIGVTAGVASAATTAAMNVMAVSIRMLISSIGGMVHAASEAEDAEAMITQALGFTSHALLEQSSALQSVTRFGDDQIQNAQALIAAYTQDESKIKTLTRSTLDLAAAKKMDLAGAAEIVAKSFGTSTNALKRQGIAVEGVAGSTERLTSLTEGISRLYGGQAEVAGATFAGRLIQVKNAYGDLQEEIGFLVTKNSVVLGAMNLTKQAFERLGQVIKDNRQWILELTKEGFVMLMEGITLALRVLQFFHNGWLGLRLVAQVVLTALIETTNMLYNALRLVLNPLDVIYAGMVKLGLAAANPFDKWQESIDELRSSNLSAGADLIAYIESVNGGYDSMVLSAEGYTTALRNLKAEQAAFIGPRQPRELDGGDGPTKAQEDEAMRIQKMIDLAILKDMLDEEHLFKAELRVQKRNEFMGMEVTNQEAYDELSAQSTAARMAIATSAYSAMEEQMLSLVETGHFSVKEFAKIVVQQVKLELIGIAARATILAIYSAAMAWMSYASGNVVSGAAYTAAAWNFTAAAIATGTAAMGLQALAGSSTEGSAAGSSAVSARRESSASGGGGMISSSSTRAQEKAPQSITVIINNPLSDENWDRIVQDNIVPAINSAGERNVKISLRAVEAN